MLIMIRSLVPTYLPAAEEGNLENNLKLNPSKVKKDYFMDIAIYPSIFVSPSLCHHVCVYLCVETTLFRQADCG